MENLNALFQNEWFYIVSVILFVGGHWLLDKIFPAWLKHTYDARLEILRRQLLARDKAALISDLLVLLRRPSLGEEEKDKVDKHLLDLCLYLPPCLIHKMAHTLKHDGTKEDLNPLGLFVEIRSFIHGTYEADKKRQLTSDNIPLTERKTS